MDDAFHSHPKARKAGLEAVGLWTLAGSHCMAYLTDGFVPEWWVKEKPRGATLAKRLVAAGLWRNAKRDGEQGFQFHDWKPECCKAHVLSNRERARIRKQKQRESRVTDHGTDAVSPASCLVPTQPNPTQPITSMEISSGVVTEVDAHEPPTCRKHPGGNAEMPCAACGRRRKWESAQEEARKRDELDSRRRLKELRENCPLCLGTNVVEVSDGAARKCDHQQGVTG